MYSITITETLNADASAVWDVWSDPEGYPRWDSREVYCRLDGGFVVGGSIQSKQRGNPGGTAKITDIEPGSSWTAVSPLPGGALKVTEAVRGLQPGRTEVSKTYVATGPLELVFRIWFAPRLRKSVPESFAALESEANRRG